MFASPAVENAPVKDERDAVRSSDVEVLADDFFEEHSPGEGSVQGLGEGELGLQDRDVIAVAGAAVRSRERMRESR